MKKILFIGVILLGVFLIYLSHIDTKIFYLSLGDELAQGYNEFNKDDYGYSDYVKDYLKNKGKLELYVDNYFKENLRTTDLIRMINDNEKVLVNSKYRTIQNALIKADLVTISIGNNDLASKLNLYKNYSDKEIYNYIEELLKDLEELFILLRKNCKEKIVFIGFYNNIKIPNVDKYYDYLNKKTKKLSLKYNIEYIDILNLMKDEKNINNSLYPSKEGYINIGKLINLFIDKQFKM